MGNFRDLIGQTFGELTVEDRLGKNKYNMFIWKCKCSCGKTKDVPTNYLTSGDTKTCGDRLHKLGPRRDLSGDVYGNLTVLKYDHTQESNSMGFYLCKCQCGNEKVISHGNLRYGHTKSCGCMVLRGEDSHYYKHGKSNTKVHRAWVRLKDRCLNPSNSDYYNYGAKGITVSPEFMSFDKFYDEIGDPPSHRHSVDRIDHTKGYEPGNVRWADDDQQARNKGKTTSNTSGVTGVQFYHSGKPNHTTYVVSTWYSLGENGKPENKKFSVRKLGLLPAFKLACEYRLKMIEELNAQGAGYTSNHGK